jgi:hypothetical protein
MTAQPRTLRGRAIHVALLGLLALVPAVSSLARPAAKPPAHATTNLTRAVNELQKAQQALDKTQGELRRAESAHLAASNTLHEVSQKAAKKHSDRLGVPAAAAAVSTAEETLKQARQAVTDSLASDTDYAAAKRSAQQASDALSKLNDDKSLSTAQYEERSRELTAGIRHPLDLERAAADRDPAAREAKRRLEEAQQRFERVEREYRQAFAADPNVTREREALKKADATLETARHHADQAAQTVAKAQAKVTLEEEAIARAAAAHPRHHR